MKYTISRQFSLTNKKYNVICNGKIAAIAKISHSKQYDNEYNVEISNLIDEYVGNCSCSVESKPELSHHYFIWSINSQTNERTLFGELSYRIMHHEILYTIIIGQKIYNLRSSDLRDRRLTIIDTINTNGNFPNVLFQSNDFFSYSNSKCHINVHDKEWPLGYVAINILLHLHET